MDIKLLNVGFGNILFSHRIVAVVSPDSAPIKRMIQETRERGRLVDATSGRRTRSVVITDSDHVILCSLHPDTIAQRLNAKESEDNCDV